MKTYIVEDWEKQLASPFKQLMIKYIDYKESLGVKPNIPMMYMQQLDELAAKLALKDIAFTEELISSWNNLRDNEKETNRYKRAVYLRDFARFVQLEGYDVILPKVPKVNRRSFVPYIFTKEEIERIFYHCDRLHVHRKYMNSSKFVMPALIRLLYGSGMRIGECLEIKHKDISLSDGVVTLRHCKNKAERMVPLSISLRETLKDYVSEKERFGLPTEPDSFFFTAPDGSGILPGSVRGHFKAILTRARITSNQPIRVHDLRHTFCVHSLANMSMRGMDLYVSLPILMQYVGHKTVSATNYYVRLTDDRYPNILKSMEEYARLFPDIDNPDDL